MGKPNSPITQLRVGNTRYLTRNPDNVPFDAFSNSPPSPKSDSRHHEARRAPTLPAGSTFYPASAFLQSVRHSPPPPLEGPDLYGTRSAAGAASTVVPPYSPPVFPGELQHADQGLVKFLHLRMSLYNSSVCSS